MTKLKPLKTDPIIKLYLALPPVAASIPYDKMKTALAVYHEALGADDELVEKLTNYDENTVWWHLGKEAADRITALQGRAAELGAVADRNWKTAKTMENWRDREIAAREAAEAELAKRVELGGKNQYCSPGCPNLLAAEARVAVLEAQSASNYKLYQGMQKYYEKAEARAEKAEAENVRLRKALEHVLEDDGMVPRASSGCRAVVRAALKGD